MTNYDTEYERRRLRLLSTLIPPGRGVVVDIGCHTGQVGDLAADRGYQVVGYDLDPEMVAQARARRPERRFELGSAAHGADVADRAGTICLEVLAHLPYDAHQAFIADLARPSPPGSWLLFSTPMRTSVVATWERVRQHRWHDYQWWDETHVAVTRYRRVHRLLREAGFEVERKVGFHFLPYTQPFAVRGPLAPLGMTLIVVARRV